MANNSKQLTHEPKEYVTLYIVRHGETVWNAEDILQGQLDSPLTSAGEEQARQIGDLLKDVEFAAVFTSDLARAQRTAEIAMVERELAVVTSEMLRERNWGEFDGRKYAEFQSEARQLIEQYQKLGAEQQWSFKYSEEIESNEEVFGRFMTFLREVAVAYPGETVLVVSHLNVMEILMLHLGKRAIHTENAACIVLRTNGVDLEVDEISGMHFAER